MPTNIAMRTRTWAWLVKATQHNSVLHNGLTSETVFTIFVYRWGEATSRIPAAELSSPRTPVLHTHLCSLSPDELIWTNVSLTKLFVAIRPEIEKSL